MRLRAAVLMILAAAAVGGCGITRTVTVEITPGAPVNLTIKPAPGAQNAGAEAPRAIDVVSERLRLLGAGNFSTSGGADQITASVGGDIDRLAAQQAVRIPGVLQFVIRLDAGASPPAIGGPADGLEALWPDDQVDAVSSGPDSGGTATVTVQLSDAGTQAFNTATAGHAGELLVIALDGRVLGSMTIHEPASGPTSLTFPAPFFVSPPVLTAILQSGPLPAAWRQP